MAVLKNWAPVVAGMFCMGLGAGLIGIYGFFVEPLSREFDVGVALLNLGPVALLLVPGFVAPAIGKLADRLPMRGLMLTGVTVAMLSLVGISQAAELWMAAVGFLFFALGLTMYGPAVVNGLMIKIYTGREARALAIAAIGISLATAVLPPLIGFMLERMDWRVALYSLAFALLVVLFVVVTLCVPPGVIRSTAAESGRVSEGIYRQPAFWLIGLCVAIALNVSIVLAVCYPPHFAAQGYTVAQAGWFLSLSGIAGLTGKATMAWLGDAARHYAKWMAIFLLMTQATGLLLLSSSAQASEVVVALMIMGFAGGAFLPMHPYLNSQYFDPAVISQVNGAQMPLFLPFGMIGAPLAGYVYDQTGSYHNVLLGLIAAFVVAALFAAKLPAPRK